ncbi:MAG: TlyA family RNA methyltransferase [Oscillospiraceae bacterium]|jgi:23S rRNA (cytidine1920-2'-O)/16S rRNA (cytidine1409-2'-O)-methyltransferase|nr:TlyA family RNA methyltransferase [Oscillospiraceae bacterium]
MKQRLDAVLVQKGLAGGRDKAKALIMAGQVYIAGQRVDKPGLSVEDSADIEVRGGTLAYVGRGGLKLEKALKVFPIDLDGKVCMDIGASTGGFTDCMLQNGASKVYAVDVGYGQLAWSLRTDHRVVVMERTNIRGVTPDQVEPLDFAGIDVSFISLTLVLPVAKALLRESGELVCLIKPQFEAGRQSVGKNGVVRVLSTHVAVAEKIRAFAEDLGFCIAGFDYSPIKGPQGNIEYLLHLRKSRASQGLSGDDIAATVWQSHEALM